MFKDKVVLITGSSRGIGKAIAIEFAKNNAKTIINCVSGNGKGVIKEIKKLGGSPFLIKADISKEKDVLKVTSSLA